MQLHNRLAKQKNKGLLNSQDFDGLTNMTILGLLGVAAGLATPYIIGDFDMNPIESTLVGAGIGAGTGLAGSIGGILGAWATKTRSTKQQAQYQRTGSPKLNYLVPGVADYNGVKTDQYLDSKEYSNQLKKAR